MENVAFNLDKAIAHGTEKIIDLFPDDLFIRLILAAAALVIVFGIVRLFTNDKSKDTN